MNTTLLIAGLPPGSLCGLNLLSFTTSEQFRGIKNIPPGWHFLYAASTLSQSLRHGCWVEAGKSATISKKWSGEELLDDPFADATTIPGDSLSPFRWSANDDEGDFKALTDKVTGDLLRRILGKDLALSSASSALQDIDEIPGLSASETGTVLSEELNFVDIDLTKTWPDGAVGRERTTAARDKSWALDQLLQKYSEIELLGELQFCFLMVLILGNYSCFEQWKRILKILLASQEAVRLHSSLYVAAFQILRLQLSHYDDIDGGLFDVSDQRNNILARDLATFRRTLDDVKIKAVSIEFSRLELQLKKDFDWDLSDSYVRKGFVSLEDGEQVELEVNDLEAEDERGEYAPVIVDAVDTIPSDQRS